MVVLRPTGEGKHLQEKTIITDCIAAEIGRDAVDFSGLLSEILALSEALNRSVA
ncbi:hypothetical protein HJB79_00035 [Rhizobium lentis]|uniref:hypothetical protein n=1 Tax=Rhizobium TaxID=379 RepID=UPI0016227108|nr:hypothetical protein [Rhizobium sp. BK049]MBX5131086.1 hypothetical protein [Rhizobium lentis]MBB3354416.1 hypothetical protein [Rhizobium sp. BK049]MBX5137202.1 hypothetical protein [Rhizobium lentis]MBX5149395.1 hypothetical protein [Rhizobium lentis]MBX5178866.1 hypothetical protein [Rhizobium lentis]